jgi:hypothetical protein
MNWYKWRVTLFIVLDIQVLGGHLLTSLTTVSFSRRTLLHEVGYLSRKMIKLRN